jgi:hypothetical protein
VGHAGSQHGDADHVGAAEQAESKPVGWQFVEVVVVQEDSAVWVCRSDDPRNRVVRTSPAA